MIWWHALVPAQFQTAKVFGVDTPTIHTSSTYKHDLLAHRHQAGTHMQVVGILACDGAHAPWQTRRLSHALSGATGVVVSEHGRPGP